MSRTFDLAAVRTLLADAYHGRLSGRKEEYRAMTVRERIRRRRNLSATYLILPLFVLANPDMVLRGDSCDLLSSG